jgi:CubicO group peptidase (beta-lactamase class C family)
LGFIVNIICSSYIKEFVIICEIVRYLEALSNFILTSEPGSKFQYSDFGLGLLGYMLSLKAGVPYEQLVKDRILNVLGMNDTKITLSQDDIKNTFPVGYRDATSHAIALCTNYHAIQQQRN